jgi:hypothetical protein
MPQKSYASSALVSTCFSPKSGKQNGGEFRHTLYEKQSQTAQLEVQPTIDWRKCAAPVYEAQKG